MTSEKSVPLSHVALFMFMRRSVDALENCLTTRESDPLPCR